MKTLDQLNDELDKAQHAHHKAISKRNWAAQKAAQTFGTSEENRWAIEHEKALDEERAAEGAAKRALAAKQKALAK